MALATAVVEDTTSNGQSGGLAQFGFVSQGVGAVVDKVMSDDFGLVVVHDDRRRRLVATVLERSWVASRRTVIEPTKTGSNQNVNVVWFRCIVRYDLLEDDDQEVEESRMVGRSQNQQQTQTTNSPVMVELGNMVGAAVSQRIQNGTLLEWLQRDDSRFVGVSEPGLETEAELVFPTTTTTTGPSTGATGSSGLRLTSSPWSLLQSFGTFLFVLLAASVGSLCVTAHHRRKSQQAMDANVLWSPSIQLPGGVDDLLARSSLVHPSNNLTSDQLDASPMVISVSQRVSRRQATFGMGVRYHEKPTLASRQKLGCFDGQMT